MTGAYDSFFEVRRQLCRDIGGAEDGKFGIHFRYSTLRLRKSFIATTCGHERRYIQHYLL
jgi:hypothetical protein